MRDRCGARVSQPRARVLECLARRAERARIKVTAVGRDEDPIPLRLRGYDWHCGCEGKRRCDDDGGALSWRDPPLACRGARVARGGQVYLRGAGLLARVIEARGAGTPGPTAKWLGDFAAGAGGRNWPIASFRGNAEFRWLSERSGH